MPWSSYWIAPWMFLGPLTTFLLMMICMGSISVMTRVGTMRHVNTKMNQSTEVATVTHATARAAR